MHFANDSLRVLVSGAAGGVGLACAEAFAAAGAELILSDLDGTALTRAAERLGAQAGFCDALSESSVAIFAADVAERVPSLDVLINAAADGYVRSLAMMRMSRALLPLLRRGSGRRFVVNLPPSVGPAFADDIFPYASSRPAFERLTRALAEQTKGTSIEVVSVAPGNALPDSGHGEQSRRAKSPKLDDVAERIVALVAEARPQWRRHEAPSHRRA